MAGSTIRPPHQRLDDSNYSLTNNATVRGGNASAKRRTKRVNVDNRTFVFPSDQCPLAGQKNQKGFHVARGVYLR